VSFVVCVLKIRPLWLISRQDDTDLTRHKEDLQPLSTKETLQLASIFCFIWFAANWAVNASLDFTSVASATIMSSMSGKGQWCLAPPRSSLFFLGFFTLGIGRIFKVESLSVTKVVAVMIRCGAFCVSFAIEPLRQNTSTVSLVYFSFHSRTRHKLRPETMASLLPRTRSQRSEDLYTTENTRILYWETSSHSHLPYFTRSTSPCSRSGFDESQESICSFSSALSGSSISSSCGLLGWFFITLEWKRSSCPAVVRLLVA
jgi:hypothetical protein